MTAEQITALRKIREGIQSRVVRCEIDAWNKALDAVLALVAPAPLGLRDGAGCRHEWVKCDIGTACKTCGASGPYELPDTTPYHCFDARFVKPLGVWHRANSVCVDCGVPVPQGALCAPCHTVRSEPTPAPSGGAGEVQPASPLGDAGLRELVRTWARETEFTRTCKSPADAGDQLALREAYELMLALLDAPPTAAQAETCLHEFDSESAEPYRCTRKCGYEMPHRSPTAAQARPTRERNDFERGYREAVADWAREPVCADLKPHIDEAWRRGFAAAEGKQP